MYSPYEYLVKYIILDVWNKSNTKIGEKVMILLNAPLCIFWDDRRRNLRDVSLSLIMIIGM